MTPRLEPQRTLEYQSDRPDDSKDVAVDRNNPILSPVGDKTQKPKKPAKSKKGQHRGGKWSWSDDERLMLLEHSNEFDQALIGPGSFWGYRISELLSLKVGFPE